MIHFMLCFSRQCHIRMERWYSAERDTTNGVDTEPSSVSLQERTAVKREVVKRILGRKRGQSSFLEWRHLRIVYKRYASLVFCCAIDPNDNELITLEYIHRYVELLDRYFGNVCELDLIFNVDCALSIWDELFIAGELQESSGIEVLEAMRKMNLKLAQCKGVKQI